MEASAAGCHSPGSPVAATEWSWQDSTLVPVARSSGLAVVLFVLASALALVVVPWVAPWRGRALPVWLGLYLRHLYLHHGGRLVVQVE